MAVQDVAREAAGRAVELKAVQKQEELQAVLLLLMDMGANSGIEIGMRYGGATAALCQICRRIIGVDLALIFDRDSGDYPGLRAYIGDSHDLNIIYAVKRHVQRKYQDGVDFLFLDGDHSYEGVRRDFRNYAPLVRSGGLVFFHDITDNPDAARIGIEIPRYWNEVRKSYDDSGEIVCYDGGTWHPKAVTLGHSNWGGIGWLRLP